MKLEKLIVENFRQFRGRQELTFATGDEQNITLVHGENGFGKTALLNALLWGFYGHEGLSADLPRQERILNQTVAAVSKVPEVTEAVVLVHFEHEEIHYTLRRSLTLAQQNHDYRKAELRLDYVRDGQTYNERVPQSKIYAIMPLGISPLLFFNGENIDHLAMDKNASLITEAIHQMLGLNVLTKAIEDLKHPSVRGKLRAELRAKTSDEKAALLDRQTALDEKIARHKQDRATAEANHAAVCADLEKIDDKLLANRAAYELQKRRAELQENQTKKSSQRAAITKRLTQIIAEDGFTLFSPDLVRRGRDIIHALRSEGAIPARVMNDFVEELLEHAQCICHRPLSPGSAERQAVEQLLTRAGDPHFNHAVSALDNAIGVLEGAYSRTQESVRSLNTERLELAGDLTVIDEELASISQKLSGKEDEEVHQLETKRARLQLQEREYDGDMKRLDGRLTELNEERETIAADIKKLKDKEAAAQLAQRRLDGVEQAVGLLERILEVETEELRPLLNDEIKNHFLRIIDRPYWPDLSPDFVLSIRQHIVADELTDPLVMDVGPSTGQRQVTSLVFIASLVALAKRRAKIPTILRGLSGSEYPIVMDSPFGSLSTRFREGVTRWIPTLAPEVVVLISDTQFKGPVEKILQETKKVGRRYFLRLHGPGLGDKEEDVLTTGGHTYRRYVEASEEYTEIVEINE